MEKEQWIVLLAFLTGCVFTEFMGKEMLVTYGILNEYFLSQYSYRAIDGNQLFCYILMERSKMAVAVFLFGRVLNGKLFSMLAKSIAAAEIGFLLTVAVVNLGVRGIPVCLAAMFPQWLFYFGILTYYANVKKSEAAGWVKNGYMSAAGSYLTRGIILLGGMAMGVITECYVNPLVLAYVLNFF